MAQRNTKAKPSAVKQAKRTPAPRRMHGLSFTLKGTKTRRVSWWHVAPTGHWPSDLETGRQYAREFLPFMRQVGGQPMLGWIVDGMAKAAGPQPLSDRRIDGIASGFLMEVVAFFQMAHVGLSFARCALVGSKIPLALDFKARFESGSMFHEPKFKMLRVQPPTKRRKNWIGYAVHGADLYAWGYRLTDGAWLVEREQPFNSGKFVPVEKPDPVLLGNIAQHVLLEAGGLA